MISKIASSIADMLCNNDTIDEKSKFAYQYGWELFLSSILSGIIIISCGFIFKDLTAALFYLVMFVLLRWLCGGYHADSYWKCNLICALTTIFVLLCYKIIPLEKCEGLHYCSIALSLLIIILYSPIENTNKPLTVGKKKLFRILSIIMVTVLSITSCVLMIKYLSQYSVLIDMTLLVVAVSMLVTDFRRGGEKICTIFTRK